jgi:hypothetical protein
VKVYSRLSGESFEPTPEDKHNQRMARLRNRVYWGVEGVSRETLYEGGRMIMLTLTYSPRKHWAPQQINSFMSEWRKEWGRAYVWVAELQKRGAMHYHVLTSLPDGAVWSKKHVEFLWYFGLVWITDDIQRPMYLMKYLQKEYQKNGNRYPKGSRVTGSGGTTHYISDGQNRERLGSRLPHWVQLGLDKREIGEIGGLVYRVRGGYWLGGGMAICPYSRNELPSSDDIQQIMSLAHFGRIVYTDGGWKLPATTQLPERTSE